MPEETVELLRQSTELLENAMKEREEQKRLMNEDRKVFLQNLSKDIAGMLGPVLEEMSQNTQSLIESNRLTKEEVLDALRNAEPAHIEVNVPPIKVPEANVNVNIPPIKMPKIEIPNQPERTPTADLMEFKLKGVDLRNPLPVLLTDPRGEPYIAGQMSGGNILTFKDIRSSSGASLINADGRLRVGVDSTGGGTQFAEDTAHTSGDSGTMALGIRTDTPTNRSGTDGDYEPYQMSEGLLWTRVRDIQTSAGTSIINQDNSDLKVRVQNGLTIDTFPDNEPFNIAQINGLATGFNSGVANNGTQRIVHVVDVATSTNTIQLAGTNISVNGGVVGAGVQRIVHVVDVASSTNTIQLGGNTVNTGAGTVGTGTQRIVVGSDSTTMIVGDIASDVADDASNPVKFGGVARTANPTAVGAGDRVSATFDDVGRQVIWPYQVRDLITTAHVQLTTGSEATLLAGAASTFHDLVYIMGGNTSAGAIDIDVRDQTGGAVILRFTIPADSTAGVAPVVPIPQNEAAAAWTVDMDDVTNTTVNLTALFVKNV